MEYKISIKYFEIRSSANIVPAYSSLQFTYVNTHTYDPHAPAKNVFHSSKLARGLIG